MNRAKGGRKDKEYWEEKGRSWKEREEIVKNTRTNREKY